MKNCFKKALAFAILCVICIHSAFAQYRVTNNPYEGIDWGKYKGYKAAFHVHSTYSDGGNTQKDMLITHYNRDYSIVTMTDHGYFNEEWYTEPKKANDETESSKKTNLKHLDSSEQVQINKNLYTKNGRTIDNGMIGLTWGNEPFYAVDGNIDKGHSFTANAYFEYSAKNDNLTTLLQKSKNAGGINYIHHPGRYTGGKDGGSKGEQASNDENNINKYVGIFKNTNALGMEIINKLDNESRSDRILYDNILKKLAPENRKVWAFSSDDSHSINEVGYSFNVMFLDTLTRETTTQAMRNGTFYAVARVDRREEINNVNQTSGDATTANNLLGQPVPVISKIEVNKDDGIITITGTDYTTIEWIADGVKILAESRNASGNTLNLNDPNYESKIGRYVRAQLKSDKGIAFTQPFYVQNLNIKVDPPYTKPTGLTGIEGAKLSSVVLPTVADGVWAWVDGEQEIKEGTLPYKATFTPEDLNAYKIVTVDVNVIGTESGSNIYEVSKFGDYYYYKSVTNAQRLTDYADMSSLSGWDYKPTSIGFGTTPTPITTISTPSTRHTWTYFKKEFTIDNKNFDASKVISLSGKHQIDDALIMYINGIEVYRFNTGTSSTKIGDVVNWDKYAGNTVTAATQINFAIDSEYGDRVISGISGNGNTPLREAASLKNLKSALKSGVNVITCVVGQVNSTSSDLFFDLQMSIKEKNSPPQPYINIKDAELKPNTIYTYNGNQHKPIIMLGGKELVEGVDYTAIYTKNINAGDEATIEVKGIGDYIGNKTLLFNIEKAPQAELNIASVSNKTFGDETFELSATGGTAGAITYELVSGPGTVTSAGKVTITGAGNIVVKAIRAGDENYYPVEKEITIEVAKKPVTVTAIAKTKVYGSTDPGLTYSVEPVLKSSDEFTGKLSRESGDNVGTYAITKGTLDEGDNYIVTFKSANFTITAKPVTITGITASNKIYDGNATATFTGTPVVNGKVGSDVVTVTNGTASFANKNIGTGKPVTFTGFTLSGTDAGNYTLSAQPASVTANITAKPLTLTVTSITATNKVYDGTTTAEIHGTDNIIGKVSGDDITIVKGNASFNDKNVGTNKPVTFKGFSYGGADINNYTVSEIDTISGVTANITAKPVTITGVTAISRIDNGTTTVELTGGTLNGVLSGDVVGFTLGNGTIASATAGTNKPVTTDIKLTGTDASNYNLTQPTNITVTITAAPSSSSSSVVPSSSSVVPSSSSVVPSSSSVAPSSSSVVPSSSSSSSKGSSSSTAPVVVADKCGTSTINYEKQFCYNDKVYSLCNGSEYDPEYEKCSGTTLQYKCGNDWYDEAKKFCWNDTKVYTLCGGSSYDPDYEKCQSGEVVSKTTPILPQSVLGNIIVKSTGNAILLSNLPSNAKVEVYNLQGKLIFTSGKSVNRENRGSDILAIEVQTGMYIVKVGNQTMRIAVR